MIYQACGGGYFTIAIAVVVLLLGLVLAIQGSIMDVTVGSSSSGLLAGGRTVNVDLLRQQEVLIRLGCTAFVTGAVLLCLGQLISNSRYRVVAHG